jgi:hypothetical protein
MVNVKFEKFAILAGDFLDQASPTPSLRPLSRTAFRMPSPNSNGEKQCLLPVLSTAKTIMEINSFLSQLDLHGKQ